mmetsp:Transcript_16068/g.48827  ORF Transcript_16068/g.48827 Transcript_16068/m.48827 type:complete len:137 (-) Transcript_16068:1136-1546(-)
MGRGGFTSAGKVKPFDPIQKPDYIARDGAKQKKGGDDVNEIAIGNAQAEVLNPWRPRQVHKDAGPSMLPVAVIAPDGVVSWMNSRAAPGADGLWPWMVLEGGVLRTIRLDVADHMPAFGLQRARTYIVDPNISPPS